MNMKEIKNIKIDALPKDWKEMYEVLKEETSNFENEDALIVYEEEITEFLNQVKARIPQAIETSSKKDDAPEPEKEKEKKPSKRKNAWQDVVKEIMAEQDMDYHSALKLYNIRKKAEKSKKEGMNKMLDTLKDSGYYNEKELSKDGIDPKTYNPTSKEKRERMLGKDAKQGAVTDREEVRKTGKKFKRLSPTFGKPDGAKLKYYYEYRMNRRDKDAKIRLAKGGRIFGDYMFLADLKDGDKTIILDFFDKDEVNNFLVMFKELPIPNVEIISILPIHLDTHDWKEVKENKEAYYEALGTFAIKLEDWESEKPKFKDGGNVHPTQLKYEKANREAKVKFLTLLSDEQCEYVIDTDWSISPIRLVTRALMSNLISFDEINKELLESAIEVSEDSMDDEEIGSSDETYKIMEMLNGAGFKATFVEGKLSRVDADGKKKEIYMKGGVMGDVFSLEDPNQFKQVITVYNELSERFGVNNYFLDHNINAVVFLCESNLTITKQEEIQSYINSLNPMRFDVFSNEKNSKLKFKKETNSTSFTVYLDGTIKFAKGGSFDGREGLNALKELFIKNGYKVNQVSENHFDIKNEINKSKDYDKIGLSEIVHLSNQGEFYINDEYLVVDLREYNQYGGNYSAQASKSMTFSYGENIVRLNIPLLDFSPISLHEINKKINNKFADGGNLKEEDMNKKTIEILWDYLKDTALKISKSPIDKDNARSKDFYLVELQQNASVDEVTERVNGIEDVELINGVVIPNLFEVEDFYMKDGVSYMVIHSNLNKYENGGSFVPYKERLYAGSYPQKGREGMFKGASVIVKKNNHDEKTITYRELDENDYEIGEPITVSWKEFISYFAPFTTTGSDWIQLAEGGNIEHWQVIEVPKTYADSNNKQGEKGTVWEITDKGDKKIITLKFSDGTFGEYDADIWNENKNQKTSKSSPKRTTIKDSDIVVGAKFKFPNDEIITIKRLFNEPRGGERKEWVEYMRDGIKKESSVYALRLFCNNWKAVKLETKSKMYHRHSEIKYVTIKKDGKEVKYSGEDVLNGANVFEEGGKLNAHAKYVSNRNIVKVELQDGTEVHPKNGYWIDKDAEPIGDKLKAPEKKSLEFKFDTFTKKGYYGWQSVSEIDNINGYDWKITTMKRSSGKLVSIAQGGKNDKSPKGYSTFMFTVFQDPSITLLSTNPSRVTDKVVSEQQDKALDIFKEKMLELSGEKKEESNVGKYGKENSRLVNFDLDDLDIYEDQQYQDFSKSMPKAEALQIIINNVEGDYSQLSSALSEIAMEQDGERTEYAEGGNFEEPIGIMKPISGKVVGSVAVSEDIRSSEVNDFVNYVYAVYEDQGYTKSQVKQAVNKYIRDLGRQFTYGGGDSLDRERVYEYLLNPNLVGVKNPSIGGGSGDDFYIGQSIIIPRSNYSKLDDSVRAIYEKFDNKELVIEKIESDKPYNTAKVFVRSNGEKVPFDIILNPKHVTQYAEGGEIPKQKSLLNFLINEASSGMIANKTPYSDYATIDEIRKIAIGILNNEGDRMYSLKSFADIIQEALESYESNITKGGGADEVITIYIDNYPYFLKKGGDTTHFYMANSKEGVDIVIPSHVGQHRGLSYYSDVVSWLKGGKSPDGNHYTDPRYRKGGNLDSDDDKYIVVSKRDGKSVVWNDVPLSKAKAEELADDLKKAKIPSVDNSSITIDIVSKNRFADGGSISDEISYLERRINNLEDMYEVSNESEQPELRKTIDRLKAEKSKLEKKTFSKGGSVDLKDPFVQMNIKKANEQSKERGEVWLVVYDKEAEKTEAMSKDFYEKHNSKNKNAQPIFTTDNNQGVKFAEGGSVDEELLRSSAERIYKEKGMMGLRNAFLQLANTDEKAGDIEGAELRRKIVSEYQSKQPRMFAEGGSFDQLETVPFFSDLKPIVRKKLGDIVVYNTEWWRPNADKKTEKNYMVTDIKSDKAKGYIYELTEFPNKKSVIEVDYFSLFPETVSDVKEKDAFLGYVYFNGKTYHPAENFNKISKKGYSTKAEAEKILKPSSEKPKSRMYHRHSEIKYVTIKKDGKEVKYSGDDVLNGANVFKEGGKLNSHAKYVSNRNIVKVELQDGTVIEPKNGYWIDKDAEPILKYTTSTLKSGNVFKVRVRFGKGMDKVLNDTWDEYPKAVAFAQRLAEKNNGEYIGFSDGQVEKTWNIKDVFNKGDKFKVHGWIMLKGVDAGTYEVVSSDDDTTTFVRVLPSGKLSAKKLRFKKLQLFGSVRPSGDGDNNRIEMIDSASKENENSDIIRFDLEGFAKGSSKEVVYEGKFKGTKSEVVKHCQKLIKSKNLSYMEVDYVQHNSFGNKYTVIIYVNENGMTDRPSNEYVWDKTLTQNSTKTQKKLSEHVIKTIDVYDDFMYGLNFEDESTFTATTTETVGLLSITSNAVKLAVIFDNNVVYNQKIKRRLHKMAESSNRVIVLNNESDRIERRMFPFLLVSQEDANKYEKAQEFYLDLETPSKALKKSIDKNYNPKNSNLKDPKTFGIELSFTELKELVDKGLVTYRGLGLGKAQDDFMKKYDETGWKIKVNKKEYVVGDTLFNAIGKDTKIRFDAPFRKA